MENRHPMKSPLRRKWRTWCADLRVKLRYGTATPTAIRLPGCDHLLEIDPNDRRARQILIRDVARGRSTKGARLWRIFNESFCPEVLVDVGLNYGECLLGSTYADSVKLFGFEANPRIFQIAGRSRQNHPNHSQIRLFNVLVADEAAPERLLYVDPDWSGTATAVAGAIRSNEKLEEHKIAAETLDRLVPEEDVAGRKLMFKIDIEGYEPKALKGFAHRLRAAREAMGLIEFDTKFLNLGDTNPADFLRGLNEDFHVFTCGERKEIEFAVARTLADLPPAKGENGRQHTDLLLVKKTAGWLDGFSEPIAARLRKAK